LKFFDYDNDGDLDLFAANGHPDDKTESHSSHAKYREPLRLFHREGELFREVGASAGSAFSEGYAARGLAIGDFNDDGAVDVLIAVNNGAPLPLRNNAAAGHHWLGVRKTTALTATTGIFQCYDGHGVLPVFRPTTLASPNRRRSKGLIIEVHNA
jgi:FG-GAP-like repeat